MSLEITIIKNWNYITLAVCFTDQNVTVACIK